MKIHSIKQLGIALLAAIAVNCLAAEIPFESVFKVEGEVRVPIADSAATSDYVEVPALPPKADMTAVLKLNIRQLTTATDGWNPWCTLEMNGTLLNSTTAKKTPRLLLRGPFMHTNYKGEEKVNYWGGSSFLTLFTATEEEVVDPIILDQEYGYDFYFDVDDLASKVIIGADERIENDAPNRMRFTNMLTKSILNSTLLVKGIELGYVPTKEILALSGLKLATFDNVAKPSAVVNGKGYKVKVSENGGMQLTVNGENYFIESEFSYPASPEMKYNTLGIASKTNQEGVKLEVLQKCQGAIPFFKKKNEAVIKMTTPGMELVRTVTDAGHLIKVVDVITNLTDKDMGLVWANNFAQSGKRPDSWHLAGMTESNGTDSSAAASTNPTIHIEGTSSAMGAVVEDTISRILLEMQINGNIVTMQSKGVGIPGNEKLTVEWSIYPLSGSEYGYFDMINTIREDWGVNTTVPGPYLIRAEKLPGLDLKFASVAPWFEYADGLRYTRDEYVKACSAKVAQLKKDFPGIKLMALLETNLVNFDSTTVPWGNELPLTYGNRKNPATKYGQYLSPELSKKLEAVTPLRDSLLHDKDGNIMIDTIYVYDAKPWINLMPQPELGNARFKQMMEQIQFVMNNVDYDGIYIDQFNPTKKDGVSYDKWDGYSVVLDKEGNIASKMYNYAITGATARMEIVKSVTSKGGCVLTNGHPVTREEQQSGRLSFAEMENDKCDPIPFINEMPPEFRYQAMGHLASPIILNLRPGSYSKDPVMKARVLFKGVITALRNGVLPYYYGTDIETSGPNAGGLSVANWLFPFTPVKLGAGVMVAKERTVVCKSGTYTVAGKARPDVAHFNNRGLQVENSKAFEISGKPGKWTVKVTIDDWNEVASIVVKD